MLTHGTTAIDVPGIDAHSVKPNAADNPAAHHYADFIDIHIAPDLPGFLASWDNHGMPVSTCLAHFDNDMVTILHHP